MPTSCLPKHVEVDAKASRSALGDGFDHGVEHTALKVAEKFTLKLWRSLVRHRLGGLIVLGSRSTVIKARWLWMLPTGKASIEL